MPISHHFGHKKAHWKATNQENTYATRERRFYIGISLTLLISFYHHFYLLVDILYFTFIVTDALSAISLENGVQEPHGTIFPHQLFLTTIT